ncbi:MAG: fatty acyl-AMP ligase [Cyanobacteriota bacterium]|nr:fatty acyl-AMP ligase [Cyanobacteriota bacterium]
MAYSFLIDGEEEKVSFTYEELERQARTLAANLQPYCPPGERAILLYPPGLEYIVAFLGCLYAGVIAVPAYPPRPNRSLSRLLAIAGDCQPKVALTVEKVFSGMEKQLAQTPELQTLEWFATDSLEENSYQWQPPEISSDSLAFLQYTSGSTAAPKGVAIAHGNLLHNLESIYQYFQHGPESKVVSWLPLYHDMGLIGGVLQPLYGGFPATLMSPLMFLQKPLRWLEAISREGATSSGGPNFAYDLCLRRVAPEQMENLDLSCWDVAFNGAEPINYRVLEEFAASFAACGFRREAFYPCYGMAETTLMVSGGVCRPKEAAASILATIPPNPPLEGGSSSNSETRFFEKTGFLNQGGSSSSGTVVGCGKSIPEQEIAIAHPERLTPLAPGEVGEIWVRGPSVAKGYWGKPEATEEAFSAFLAVEAGESARGPFFRTGDLGFLDEDGELFVTGRLKDLIIINGRNYYPQDFEWLVEGEASIRSGGAAAFSIYIDGEEKLAIAAEVERRFLELLRRNPNSSSPTEELIQTIKRAVTAEFDLQVYSVTLLKPGTLPKTSSGKVQRHACRAAFLAGTLRSV